MLAKNNPSFVVKQQKNRQENIQQDLVGGFISAKDVLVCRTGIFHSSRILGESQGFH